MDQNSSGLCMLFGCAPEVWQDVMSEYHAFSERIGEEVALKPLTSENPYELVRDYLDQERVSSADNEGIEPFSEEAYVLPQFAGMEYAYTGIDAVYVWTRGGYQVARDPEDYLDTVREFRPPRE